MSALSIEEQIKRLEVLHKARLITETQLAERIAALRGGSTTQTEVMLPAMTATGREIPPSDAIAPYRFVGLNTVVAKPERPSTPLNTPVSDHLCGVLEITFEAETPLLIGQEKKSDGVAYPLSLKDQLQGPWWIPGSSLRGMVRSAAEIVGYGRLSQTNKDYVFPLRDFEHPDYNASKEQKLGRKLGVWTEVKAGWLENTGQKDEKGNPAYRIFEAELSYIEIQELMSITSSSARSPGTWIEMTLSEKYRALGMLKDKVFDFSVAKTFRSGFQGKQGQPMVRPDTAGRTPGIVVVSDRSPPTRDVIRQKKLEYVFSPWNSAAPSCVVKPASWDKFEQVNTKTGRGDERRAEGTWSLLQKVVENGPGSVIPVFYTGNLQDQGEDFAFGLTRLFKVPHRVNQGEMIHRVAAHAGTGEDMVDHLFGYVWEDAEETALKSRLGFSGSTIKRGEAEVSHETLTTVMGTPNASFAPYYLEGVARDWSATEKFGVGDTQAAGRKRYLPRGDGNGNMNAALQLVRERFQRQLEAVSPSAREKDSAKSKMRFLVGPGGKPFCFTARIRMHNVSKAEAGLLVMAACFGGGDATKTFRHMLGRAKPFGAGQLRIAHYAFKAKGNSGGEPTEEDCLSALAAHMRQQGVANYPDTQVVREFLGAANPANGKALPGADGKSPIYLGLKQHADMRKRTGKLSKDSKPASATRSLLRVKKWDGKI